MGIFNFKKAWIYGYQRIIRREAPHTWMSWRFFVPVGDEARTIAFKLHRRVFFSAWRELPRFLYIVLVLYAGIRWYLWSGPRAYRRHFRLRFGKAPLADEASADTPTVENNSLYRRAAFRAYLRGILPRSFYQFKLYSVPADSWWQFVPNELLPHWHQTWQGRVSPRLGLIMANKRVFSEFMRERNIRSVASEAIKIDNFEWERLLGEHQPSYFLKPEISSQAKGCLLVERDAEGELLMRSKDGSLVLSGAVAIRTFLQEACSRQRYLLQPRLLNHDVFLPFTVEHDLVVFRVVTLRLDAEQVLVWRANIEIPLERRVESNIQRVDVKSGIVSALDDLCVPYWQEVRELVCAAHVQVAELLSVGWDVAITPDGPILIEGNINWGTTPMQYSSEHGPLIDELYIRSLNNNRK